MPTGPFGFKRFTELGPFVENDAGNFVYHFTDKEAVSGILKEGFKSGYEDKKTTLRERDLDGLAEKTSKTAAIEYIADYYKPESLEVPDRYGSTFFFNDKNDVLLKGYRGDAVIKVDTGEIPCKGGTADMRDMGGTVFMINEALDARGAELPADGRIDFVDELDVIGNSMRKYWLDKTSVYRGQGGEHMETWFNCDVPPEAIESVFTGDFGSGKDIDK